MVATTLKLTPKLKKRISVIAKNANQTPHGWMVATLANAAELAEARRDFISSAVDAAADVDAGGNTYAMEDVHAYILQKIAGGSGRRPKPIRRSRAK